MKMFVYRMSKYVLKIFCKRLNKLAKMLPRIINKRSWSLKLVRDVKVMSLGVLCKLFQSSAAAKWKQLWLKVAEVSM